MNRRNFRPSSLVVWSVAALFSVLWFGGVASYGFLGGPPSGSEAAAPGFLAVAWLLLIVAERGRRFGRLLIVGLLGFGVEVAGVWIGAPFGGYHYTDHLGPALARVPLAMIAAWPVLVAYADAIARRRAWSGWRRAVFGASWLVGIDLILDPLAAGPLGYWVWHGPAHWFGVPVSNFLGWAGVGAALTLVLGLPSRTEGKAIDPRPALWIGRAVFGFFVLLAFILQFWIPGLLGIGLLVADWKWLTGRFVSKDPGAASEAPAPEAVAETSEGASA